MKIVVVGTGFVGLTHAAVCAELGHEVWAHDIDPARIEAYRSGVAARIEHYVNEPGLSASIAALHGKNLHFLHELGRVMDGVEAVFMCVPTPAGPNGATDRSFYLKAAHQIAERLAARTNRRRAVVVNKSTVPIGTARLMERILREHAVRDVGVASNPEFLPQGNALEASRRPGRVVVGADDSRDFDILRRLYAAHRKQMQVKYIETTPETAEAVKYVANSLLFTYISYWNGVGARLAETFDNIEMEALKEGVTADERISAWGSYVGIGAGGSCFGKDIRSLIHQLESRGRSTELLQAVYRINEYQKTYLLDRAVHEAGFSFNNKTIAMLGLAFKRNTNDMRDSAALRAVEALLARGVRGIRAYDPLANGAAQRHWFDPEKNHLFERISYHDSARAAMEDSDAAYIATDLEEFRELGPVIRDTVAPPYLILDGRRMIRDYDDLVCQGYECLSVGGGLLRSSDDGELDRLVRPICEALGIFAA